MRNITKTSTELHFSEQVKEIDEENVADMQNAGNLVKMVILQQLYTPVGTIQNKKM